MARECNPARGHRAGAYCGRVVLKRYRVEEVRAQDPRLRASRDLDRRRFAFLGPLLVDFDDLRELEVILKPPGADHDEPLDIECEVGTATSVDDLRDLHDEELARGITLTHGATEVTLAPPWTAVRGPSFKVIAVQHWARYRRTRAWPRYGRYFWSAIVFLLLCALYGSYTNLFETVHNVNQPGVSWSDRLSLLGIVGTPALFYLRSKVGSVMFFPGTRQERREDRPLQRRHRFQMSLTFIGTILIPLASLGVALFNALVKR